MSIENQKKIANELLEKLEQIDPHCILAGGAPRDWYMGKEANDLDFYVYGYGWSIGLILKRFKNIGIFGLVNLGEGPRPNTVYSSMKHLRCVYETTYKGQKIQIMIMNQPTFSSVVDYFGVTISQFWYKTGRIGMKREALLSIKYKVIGYKDDFSCKEAYFKKIQERFKNYRFTKMSGFKDVILSKVYLEANNEATQTIS